MAEDFSALFSDYFARSGKTQTQFANQVGTTQPTIALVLQGKRTPRPAALARWAEALGLDGDERVRFIEAGQSARAASHKAVAPYVQQLEDDLEEAHAYNGRLHDALNDLTAAVLQSRDQIPHSVASRLLEILKRIEPES